MRILYQIIIFISLCSVSINAYPEGNIALGKAKSAACLTCHGPVNGNTPNFAWPKLCEQNAPYFTKQLLDFKIGEKAGRYSSIMTGIAASLSNEDIADLAAYYQSLPGSIGEAQPKLVDLGQRLYRGGDLQKGIPACSACHSPRGEGNAPAVFPLLSGQNAPYIVDQLQAFKIGIRHNDPNKMMCNIAAKMNDQEINAVASYIAGLH